jgi:hypothetical protein
MMTLYSLAVSIMVEGAVEWTMLRQSCRSANLKALLSCFQSSHLPPALQKLKPVMTSLGLASNLSATIEDFANGESLSTTPKAHLRKTRNLARPLYLQLLSLVRKLDADLASWHDIHDFPLPHDRQILPRSYKPVRSIRQTSHHHSECRFSDFDKHNGNSFVHFSSIRSGTNSYGKILQIFDHEREVKGELLVQTFIVIKAFKCLSHNDISKIPVSQQNLLPSQFCYAEEGGEVELVLKEHVHGHVAVQYLAAGTFDIPLSVVALVPLNK